MLTEGDSDIIDGGQDINLNKKKEDDINKKCCV